MTSKIRSPSNKPAFNPVLDQVESLWSYFVAFVTSILDLLPLKGLKSVITFAYYCFLQPLGKSNGQASRLDKFYQGQANVYDKTRNGLLKGRKKMLGLLAAELKAKRALNDGLIWVDIGGGTGWNIEQMDEFIPLDTFEAVYLVDLCEPLLEVARARLAHHKNVKIVKADATVLPLDLDQVDIITMSYSLSMIPPYFKVIDRALDLLKPSGLISVVDFFTSNKEDSAKGELNRQGNLFNRLFWRSWFEFDHVDLNPARRDYLEHKFEAIKTVSCRNNFAIPFVVSIPYYIYLGQKAELPSLNSSPESSVIIKQSGVLTPESTPLMQFKHSMQDDLPVLDMPEPHFTQAVEAKPEWTSHRLPYNPTNPDQAQFSDFIYSFVWEDPEVDVKEMNITPNDDMLVITSAGDNALDYLVTAGPRTIHCVDMNPCQGHLLELKIAAFKCLPYEDVWSLFGAGKHDNFPALLDQLAPAMSSAAYQFWSAHENAFDTCFYKSGYSGNVVKLLEYLLWITGTKQAARDMINASNLGEQRKAWKSLRKAFISDTVGALFLANPMFLWNALGVPINQLKMLQSEGTALQYAIDTLDPVVENTLLSETNFHYLLPLLQHYTKKCCPAYLKENNYDVLSKGLGALTLHTDTINNVLQGMPDASLSKAIVMDHQDWFDQTSAPFPQNSYIDTEITLFKRVLKKGGEVYWRSSAKKPWYAERWRQAGFTVTCIASRAEKDFLDAVNMYASLYRARLETIP